ncbi:MAG: hypothetical protein JST51_06820 [Armatimonadetes bacterium]|nr:hypothetical protein [Armatimonadota bacterium]
MFRDFARVNVGPIYASGSAFYGSVLLFFRGECSAIGFGEEPGSGPATWATWLEPKSSKAMTVASTGSF